MQRPAVPEDIVTQLRAICAALPETVEEAAWVGRRWRIRTHTFAHVLMVSEGWPPVYAANSGVTDIAPVLTLRTVDRLFQPDRFDEAPFFRPPWPPNTLGVILRDPDWNDLADLTRESWRLMAPRKVVARLGGRG